MGKAIVLFGEHFFSILRDHAFEELWVRIVGKSKEMEEIKKPGKLQSLLLAAWFEAKKKHDGIAPTKSQIELRSIVQAMPFIQILEVASDDDIIIRMAGSGLEQRVGPSLTGRSLAESLLDKELTQALPHLIATMVQNPFGLRRGFRHLCLETVASRASTYDGATLLLPLMGPEGKVNMAITVDEVDKGSRQLADTMINAAEQCSARMQETLWFDFIDLGQGVPDLFQS